MTNTFGVCIVSGAMVVGFGYPMFYDYGWPGYLVLALGVLIILSGLFSCYRRRDEGK